MKNIIVLCVMMLMLLACSTKQVVDCPCGVLINKPGECAPCPTVINKPKGDLPL